MEKDINEVFADIALAENRFTEIGYSEGYAAGLTLGWIEGFNFGIHKGSHLGSEMAFYLGFVEAAVLIVNNSQLSKRCLKSIEALRGMLDAFPSSPNEDIKLEEKLNVIRGKFRQVCSLLSIGSDVTGCPSRDF